jgi:hypothetical protein
MLNRAANGVKMGHEPKFTAYDGRYKLGEPLKFWMKLDVAVMKNWTS